LASFREAAVGREALIASLGLEFTAPERQVAFALLDGFSAGLRALDAVPDPLPAVAFPRARGVRPLDADNPLGAWYWRTSVKGAPHGPLAGMTVALKDNILLADVPLMNGSSVLEGYIPDHDATVVTRVLQAGGEITGKAVCENLCFSFGSHTAATGPVRNPHDSSRVTGGSSSGCAALVAARQVDFAIGGDQGGSIRVPAAFCGIVGHKPTWGLVPYTGAIPMEYSIDHLGPMARTVRDCARLLEVLAGPDGLDSRQSAALTAQPYVRLLGRGARGLRVAVLKEGFGLPGAEGDVEEVVRASLSRLEKAGMRLTEVSIPEHLTLNMNALTSLLGVFAAGLLSPLVGAGSRGPYLVKLHDWLREHRKELASAAQPLNIRIAQLFAAEMVNQRGGHLYARAQNLTIALRAAYDRAFRDADLRVMPTVARRPPRFPAAGDATGLLDAAGWGEYNPVNTSGFDNTGHPAISVPCGAVDRLPVGLMLVGRVGEDATVLRAAHAFEQA
jgi:amidase